MATPSPITIQGGGCQLGDVRENPLDGPMEFYPFYCFNAHYSKWRDYVGWRWSAKIGFETYSGAILDNPSNSLPVFDGAIEVAVIAARDHGGDYPIILDGFPVTIMDGDPAIEMYLHGNMDWWDYYINDGWTEPDHPNYADPWMWCYSMQSYTGNNYSITFTPPYTPEPVTHICKTDYRGLYPLNHPAVFTGYRGIRIL